MRRFLRLIVIPLAALGCGGDDDGGGGGGEVPDINDVISALDNPTGQLTTPEGAQGVASAYATQQANRSFGNRRNGIDCPDNLPEGSGPCECSGGGSLEYTAEGSEQTGGSIHFDASNCCESGADACCYDGSADLLVNTAAGATYTNCFVWDFTLSQCKEATVYVSWCQDAEGRQWWVVDYEGETFAVEGSYAEGVGGTWTVRDADTTWNCTEDSAGAGCCQDEASVEEDITWGGGVCP
jgi:hypothetical protein